MPLMKWSEEFNTGVREMDEQHKKWMQVINNFYDHLQDKTLKSNIAELLDEAIEYTAYHFSEEEALMKRFNYPDYEKQKEEHAKITAHLAEYRVMLDEGRLNVSQPVTSEMKSWFNNHITDMDKGYGEFINK